MKIVAAFVATLTVASAFAPQSAGRSSTQLQESLADRIFGMDLFAPNKDVNDYGSRNKKNLKQGSITSGKSYIPTGLSAEQYKKVRAADQATKDVRYKKNVKKAGIFQGYDDFYMKRGTAEGGNWLKSAGKGHTFAKTKYDYSGDVNAPMADMKAPESFTFKSIFAQKKKK